MSLGRYMIFFLLNLRFKIKKWYDRLFFDLLFKLCRILEFRLIIFKLLDYFSLFLFTWDLCFFDIDEGLITHRREPYVSIAHILKMDEHLIFVR